MTCIEVYYYLPLQDYLLFKSLGQEMKSKKEENEIFPVAPNPSKGWMVDSETEWVSLDDDSSNKDRDFGSAFPWKP